MISIFINKRKYSVPEGLTILEAAQAAGVRIPTLCHHPDLDVRASCRVCVVEVQGRDKLLAACSTPAVDGMDIRTDSPRVKQARDLNIELIFASHVEKCATCTLRFNCGLLELAKEHKIKINRFDDRKKKRRTYKFANAVEIDGTQCIDCGNCLSACDRQGISYLEISGNGAAQEVGPVRDRDKACIYCGQCTDACPVAAAQEQDEWSAVEKALLDPKQIVVAQFAPAVRVSIGEEFGLPPGFNATKKINTALKKLGFSYVFDINFGADITTMTEAEELVARLQDKKAVLPMFTSCCPAWVAYAEFYHPELIPNLTDARSPHIHSAGAIKGYFAQQHELNPKNIAVVSIVPCTSKKYEAARPELAYRGRPLVDHVLTTREFAYILKKNRIDLASLPDSETNPTFNDGSGAAAIYGASGGVMESALRTAEYLLSGSSRSAKKLHDARLEFKEVRGLKGFRSAELKLAGKKIKVGIVSGIAHFEQLLPKLAQYQYIEVMACPGGCLGGGGQPCPTTDAVRRQRQAGLYAIDSGKRIRRAHDNEAMVTYYRWAKRQKENLLTTSFKAKKK